MAAKGRGRGRGAAKGYQLPEAIPEGFEITDLTKKSYTFGKKIASGGFGTVYFASEKGKKTADFVVKVEHHGNGPLFTEMHCYQNCGKPAQIAEYVKKKKLPFLGLSPCYGTGSFELNSSKYRFMVIERFGKDLQTLLEENGRVLPPQTVYHIGRAVIDALEYMHNAGYLHGDIKAGNLLLGYKKGTENQVYLVDMGLACKYIQTTGAHKTEKPDLKKAHNGTPEFTSRDAHRGCTSRRSDLEVLCFNLLQWLVGELPWEHFKDDCKKLQQEKEKCMSDINKFLNSLFDEEGCPGGIQKLIKYVSQLGFEDEPDYKRCKSFLMDELKKIGCDKDKVLEFAKKKKPALAKASKEKASDKENGIKKRAPKRKVKEEVEPVLDPADIPTPAMLEMMKKREEKQNALKMRKKK